MRKILLFFFLCFFVGLKGNCQRGFSDYVVTGKDTIRGKLSDEIISGSDRVSIRMENNINKNYVVSEVTSIRLSNGSVYVPAKSIGLDKNIFLLYLVKGKASLFSYLLHGKEVFILTKDSQIIELDNSTQNVIRDGATVTVPSNRYIGQLHLVLGDAKQLNSQFDKTLYRANSLSSVAKKYNALMAPDLPTEQFSSGQSFLKVNFGLFVSGGYPVLKVDDLILTDYYGMSRSDFTSNSTYSAGGIILISSRDIKNFWIGLRPAFSKATYKSNVTYTDFNKVHNEIEFDLTGINVPVSIGYAFPIGNIKPFAEIGLWQTYFTEKKSNMSYVITPPNGAPPTQGSYSSFKFADHQNGFVARLGIRASIAQKHEIMMALKYERGKGIHEDADNPSSKYQNLTSTKTFSIDLSFLF